MSEHSRQSDIGIGPQSVEYPNATFRPRIELAMTIGFIASLALLLLYVSFVDIDQTMDARSIVLSQSDAVRLSAAHGGVISETLHSENQIVSSGEPLFVIDHLSADSERIATLFVRRRAQLVAKLARTEESIENIKGTSGANMESLAALSDSENQLNMSLLDIDDRLQNIRDNQRSTVSAPRRGRLIDMRIKRSQPVREGQALAYIIDEAPIFHAIAYLPSHLIGKLKIGTPAAVHLEGRNSKATILLTGHATSFSKLPVSPNDIDPSLSIKEPMFEVEITFAQNAALKDATKTLIPGSVARTTFNIGTHSIARWAVDRFVR